MPHKITCQEVYHFSWKIAITDRPIYIGWCWHLVLQTFHFLAISDRQIVDMEDNSRPEDIMSTDSKSTFTHKSKSKILKVTCGIPGCKAKPMLSQNLPAHHMSAHNKYGPIKGQNTLDSFFGSGGNCRRKHGRGVVVEKEGPESDVCLFMLWAGIRSTSRNLWCCTLATQGYEWNMIFKSEGGGRFSI